MDESPFQIDTRGEFAFPENHRFDAGYGLTEATIDYICDANFNELNDGVYGICYGYNFTCISRKNC